MESRLGTAEWEDLDVFAEKCAYEEGDFWIGRSPKDGEPIGHVDDRHIILASKNRSGKGTTTIINNLLTWQGSMVVVDPKGENATVTAARRGEGSDYCEGMGQRVFVLDPFRASSVDEKYQASFNPLDALDPKSSSVIDDAGLIADAMIPERPDAKDPYFDLSARKMLKGLILHVITAPHCEGRRNLLTVRALIRHGERDGLAQIKKSRAAKGDTGEKRRPLPSAFQLLWSDVASNDALEGIIAGIGESIANSAIEASKTFDNCLSTLDRHTEFLDSFEMRNVLERSDFQLADIKTDPKGVTLYLCLPQRYSAEHYRWLRLINTLVITMMEEVKGKPATDHRVLMVLDEFLLLEHMKIIERAVSYIAGYGLTMFFVVQSLEHLKKIYSDTWETLIANCGIKMFYAVGDHFSRKYISDMIGETEVIREAESWSEQHGTNESETSGENRSQTEGVNESTAEGKSSSQGQTDQRSSTHGTSESMSDGVSETRGWNDGESHSRSKGKQRSSSRGSSDNDSEGYAPSKLFRNTERHFRLLRENETKNLSSGSSRGNTFGKNWSKSKSRSTGTSGSKSLSRTTTGGKSHSETTGSSQSITDSESFTHTRGQNASETVGTNESKTSGTSHTKGTSRNQSVHKRPLITSDEIGRWFARPDPGSSDPAWGLVIIDDAKPAVVHRTEYYADMFFGWLFDPHPDHQEPPRLLGEKPVFSPKVLADIAEFSQVYWAQEPGSFIRSGDVIARVDLPGPLELVEVEYVSLAHTTTEMNGVSLVQKTVQLPIFSPQSGVIKETLIEDRAGFADREQIAVMSGNNRRWLLESEAGQIVHSPIEEYSLYIEDLYKREAEGRIIHAQQLEALEEAKERRRKAELLLEQTKREAEEARLAEERQAQEQAEHARVRAENYRLKAEKARWNDATRQAKSREYPVPSWVNEDAFGFAAFLVGILPVVRIVTHFELKWYASLLLMWFGLGAIAGSIESIHSFVCSIFQSRSDEKWKWLSSSEQDRLTQLALDGKIDEGSDSRKRQLKQEYTHSRFGLFVILCGVAGLLYGISLAYGAWHFERNLMGANFAIWFNAAVFALVPTIIYSMMIGVVLDVGVIWIQGLIWDSKQEEALKRKNKVIARKEAAMKAKERHIEKKKRTRIQLDKQVGIKPALFGTLGFVLSLALSSATLSFLELFEFATTLVIVLAISMATGVLSFVFSAILMREHYRRRETEK